MNGKFSITHELAVSDEGKREAIEAALAHIKALLWTYNFELRDDSRLAWLWATNRLPMTWTDLEVAHEIMSQNWICANTEYNKLSESFLRELANRMKERYGIKDWHTVWCIVKDHGPHLLKYHCVAQTSGVPNFTPMTGCVAPIKEDEP